MTRLRDDAFFLEQPAARAAPRSITAAEMTALQGIGDRNLRETQDFFWEMGASMVPGAVVETPNGRFSVGDRVAFTSPDGLQFIGRLDELSASGALVATANGEAALVPVSALERPTSQQRREALRPAIREAIRGGGGMRCVSETRAPLPVNQSGRDFAITLQGHGSNKPTEEDVLSYIATRYPGARVLDADASYPGNKLGVIIHLPNGLERAAQGMIPISGPSDLPRDKPEGAGISQEFTDDDAVSASKEAQRRRALLEQTGHFLQAIAAANPTIDFFETSIETDDRGVVSHFSLSRSGSPLFLRASEKGAALSDVLSAGSSPAVGYVVAADEIVTAALLGPKGELRLGQIEGLRLTAQYESMNSPATQTRFDEPGAYEDGQYVTQADVETEAAPPALTRSSPGEFYTKNQWEQEMQRYRDQQQMDLLQQERRKQLRQQYPEQYSEEYIHEPQPDWLDTAPLIDQVNGDVEDREFLGGPGLQVAERIEAVDQTAKDYYKEYFDEPYGEDLTRDVPTKRRDARRMITESFRSLGRRATAAQLIRAIGLLASSPRTAQAEGLAQSLLHSRQNDPQAANAIDKLVADFIARNPEALEQMGAYEQALQQAVQYWEAMEPRRLEKLRKQFAPEQDEIGTAHQPNFLQRMREKLSPMERLQREMETDALGTPSAPPSKPAPTSQPEPWRPSEAPSGPGEIDLGDFGFGPDPNAPLDLGEFGFEPDAPATPAAETPPAAAPKPPRAPRSKPTFEPTPDMQVFDNRGQPVSAPSGGKVIKRFPNGVVRFRTQDGQELTAYPPGVDSPAGPAAKPAPTPTQAPSPAAPPKRETPSFGGLGRGILDRLRGASTPYPNGPVDTAKLGYKPLGPQRGADDPTPGTYNEKPPAENYDGRRQPATAELGFRLTNLRRSGDYVVGDVVWDQDLTKTMSAKNIEHNIISFVKGRSTKKDAIDLGNIGRVRVKKLDVHAGFAEVVFRSSEARALPLEVIIREEGVDHRGPIA